MTSPIDSTANPPESEIIQTPFCGDLRSKRFFMLDAIPQRAEEFLDPSGHCWCYHTQQPIGPDGFQVVPEDCVPGRACYRSALAPAKKWTPPVDVDSQSQVNNPRGVP